MFSHWSCNFLPCPHLVFNMWLKDPSRFSLVSFCNVYVTQLYLISKYHEMHSWDYSGGILERLRPCYNFLKHVKVSNWSFLTGFLIPHHHVLGWIRHHIFDLSSFNPDLSSLKIFSQPGYSIHDFCFLSDRTCLKSWRGFIFKVKFPNPLNTFKTWVKSCFQEKSQTLLSYFHSGEKDLTRSWSFEV